MQPTVTWFGNNYIDIHVCMCGYTQKDEGIKQTWQNIKICRSGVKGIKICNLCQNLKLFQNKKL